MNCLKLLTSCVAFVGMFVLQVTGILLGLVLVPYGFVRGLVLVPGLVPGEYVWAFTSRWLWLWGNDEEGVDGNEVHSPHWASKPTFKGVWYWSAIRNPFNNIRFWEPIRTPARPDQYHVLWNNPKRGWLIRQGWWCLGFQLRVNGYRLWWGWKMKPNDLLTDALPSWDTRAEGMGFSLQAKRTPNP